MSNLSRVRQPMLLALILTVLSVQPLSAQPGRKKQSAAQNQSTGPADYRSRNFLIHTDLSEAEAKELLGKLETMLSLISRYWGRRNPRAIECFIVKDLKNWPAAKLQQMHPGGLAKIRSGAGVTISHVLTRGTSFKAIAKVYAVAQRGVPQHEAVHAYCAHAFGSLGPVWYAEGMAEMGKYWQEKDSSVNCSPYVVRYLRSSKVKPLAEIVDRSAQTGDSWQNYAWRWALCHVLANNPNYASRFRPLGLGLLMKRRTSFQRIYGAMDREIEFEYRFFIEHLERGLRVDLCRWDWKAKYRTPRGGSSIIARIDAQKGWQPSRLRVKAGQEYEYSVTGTWKTTKGGDEITADGHADGNGKLVGILFNDYKLSKPFELGSYGTFKAPSDGNLLLRCREQWSKIADNKGKVVVKLKIKGRGQPLPKPDPPAKKKSS
ncbi:MAG: hypothetical protein Tsb009_10280 [Planctomycetaceae bacterium]